jgi:hypothetical protein
MNINAQIINKYFNYKAGKSIKYKTNVVGNPSFGFITDNTVYVNKVELNYFENYPKNELCTGSDGKMKMRKGSNGTISFNFKNSGDQPLEIYEAKPSCGCVTVSYFPRKVSPGQKGTITIKYDTDRIGPFTKSITLQTNTLNKVFTIFIKGEVVNPSRECPECFDYVVQKKKPEPSVVIKPFSGWYTTKLSTFYNGRKVFFTLSCRQRVKDGNKIELELKCQSSFRIDITSKICSSSNDEANGWQTIKVSQNITKILIIETGNCNDGFWWWVKNPKFTGTFID